METQDQKDEWMALELFPDITASEPISTTMTIEEAGEIIKSLTSMLIAARTERDKLKAAIKTALASDGNTAYKMFFDMLE